MNNSKEKNLSLFRRFYEENVSSLVFFARRFVSAATAEDMVHDVFLEVWERWQELSERPTRAYLFMAVRNRCLNNLRRELVKENYLDSVQTENRLLGLDYYDSIEKLLIDRERLQELYDAIEKLPEKCRQVFKLAYYEEKKNAEIADLLDLSIRTVEHQLYLGLKTLRNKLKNDPKGRIFLLL
ncbi:RNA polymerase sigma-70 factor, partial [Parabacteroides sp. OttesenSCG-928-G06]|nr:RNA polymerase sigma-70 factor [Parabacteroides sp. OttesenSCG-928-G06]